MVPTHYIKWIPCGSLSIAWLPGDSVIDDDAVLKVLPEAEQKISQDMKAAKRRQEFIRGRWLYHHLSQKPEALLKSEAGAPMWPADIAGSITHKSGDVACCIKPRSEFSGLGIDLELNSKVKPEFIDRICAESEKKLIAKFEKLHPALNALAVIFSFKESIFKAVYPNGGIYFYFLDAEVIDFDPATATIKARLLKDVAPHVPKEFVISGTWTEPTPAHVLTCALLPPP